MTSQALKLGGVGADISGVQRKGKPTATWGRKARGPATGGPATELGGNEVKGGLAALLVLAVIAVAPTPVPGMPVVTPTGASGTADNRCWNFKPSEKGFTRKINGARGNGGLGKLSLDPELSKAARVHTREMVRKAELYHTPTESLKRRVTNWIMLGENVGVGGTVSSLHEAFMNSQGHRDNVMHPLYRHVGVGVLKAGDRMWVTIIFEANTDPGTPLKMPRC